MDLCSVWRVLEKDYDMTSPEGKTEFLREAAQRTHRHLRMRLERNNYIEAVAGTYQVSDTKT